MKRKAIFFLLIFMFGVCGVFGSINLQIFYAKAVSLSADTWDGVYPDKVSDADWAEEGDRFYINSAKGLAYFAKEVESGKVFVNGSTPQTVYLNVDINLAGKAWIPITVLNPVNGNDAFNGIFDGQGHTIYNLKITDINGNNSGNVGFFANLNSSAKIRNLNLKDVDISSTGAKSVGGIVGDTTLSNADWLGEAQKILNCTVSGKMSVTNCANVGGLIGVAGLLNVKNCSANVDITERNSAGAANIGGLIGAAKRLKMEFCYSEGDITIAENSLTSGNIGGLIGDMTVDFSTGTPFYVRDCYSNGNITANVAGLYVGGIIGKINGQVAGTAVEINHTYNAGKMEYAFNKTGSYVGGLIGFIENGNTALKNSLYLGQMETKNYQAGVGDRSMSHLANGTTSSVENCYYVVDKKELNLLFLFLKCQQSLK